MATEKTFGVSYMAGSDVRLVTNSIGWFSMTCEVEDGQSAPTEIQLTEALLNIQQNLSKGGEVRTIVPISVFPLAEAPNTVEAT